MVKLIYGKDGPLLNWAAKQIQNIGDAKQFGPAVAVGVATGESADDKLLAVIVYHDYQEAYSTCQLSLASASPKWITRGTVRDILATPFVQYRVNLLWCAIPHTAERTVQFCESLGFMKESVLRDRFGPGTHAAMMRMTADEYDDMYLAKRKPINFRAKKKRFRKQFAGITKDEINGASQCAA